VFDDVVSIPAWIFTSNWELPAKVASDDLRGALSVYYLTSTRLR
nr:hypothetical protein [Tanacetum cinerariifolium]